MGFALKAGTLRDVISASTFVRKMRGGSQSSLIRATDGNFYIVKSSRNPQGCEILLNEVLGSEILRAIGLPTPSWSPIWISEDFLQDNPRFWFETAYPGRQCPPLGLHFGSKLIASRSNEDLFEILPKKWFSLIQEREIFVGMLLFDLWANQRDHRQAIFSKSIGNFPVKVTFIDHGSLFGRDQWLEVPSPRRAMYLDPAIYANIDLTLVVPEWADRIGSLDEPTLRSLISRSSIPSQWYTPKDLDRIVSGLARRRSLLPRYIGLIKRTLHNLRLDTVAASCNEGLDELPVCNSELRSRGYGRTDKPVSYIG